MLVNVPRAGNKGGISVFKTKTDTNVSCPELMKWGGGRPVPNEEFYFKQREEYPNHSKLSMNCRNTGNISSNKSKASNFQRNSSIQICNDSKNLNDSHWFKHRCASSLEPIAGNLIRNIHPGKVSELDLLVSEFSRRFPNYNYRRFYQA